VVLGDRAFLQLAAIDITMTAVGWGVFTWLLPPYARDVIGVRTGYVTEVCWPVFQTTTAP
jgi:hypothetical protein